MQHQNTVLKCPLNGAPCPGAGKCKLWVVYTDYQGCVFKASEEIINRLAVELKDFLGGPVGKSILNLAGAILGRTPDPRSARKPGQGSNLPVPTKKRE